MNTNKPDLRSFCLNPPHASRAIDDRVLRYDLAGVDLTEGSDDAAAGEDHIPPHVSWTGQWRFDTDLKFLFHPIGQNSPLDSITLLSPIFRACDTVWLVKANVLLLCSVVIDYRQRSLKGYHSQLQIHC